MFDLGKVFGYNTQKATDGVKKVLGADEEEYILLRKLPNPEYRAEMQKAWRANEKVLSYADSESSEKISNAIVADVLSKTCVLGWGKKVADGGKVIKFSQEACKDLFVKYPEFMSECQKFAESLANYQDDVTVEDVKKP